MTSYRVGETLIDQDELRARTSALAREISTEYGDSNVLVLGVLKGAIYFMADLTRELDIPFELDFTAQAPLPAAAVERVDVLRNHVQRAAHERDERGRR